MHKMKNWCRYLSFVLACMLLVACAAGCKEEPAKPSGDVSGTTTTTTGSQSTTEGTSDNTTTTLPSGSGLFDPNGTTLADPTTTTSGTISDDTTTTKKPTTTTNSPTTTTTVPKESILHTQDNGLIRPQSKFVVNTLNYNPGMPGYDTVFSLVAIYDEIKLTPDACIFSADVDGITFKDGEITIPEKVRNAHDGTYVTVVYKVDPRYYYQLYIPFMHWELTLEDEFDTYNTDLWSNYNAGPGLANQDAHYVKDGVLILESKYDANDTNGDKYPYAWNAACSTRGKFAQSGGVFTSYMQLPEGCSNAVPSFWLMPEGAYGQDGFFKRRYSNPVAKCSEIDIFETWWGYPDRGPNYAVEHSEFYWVDGVIDWSRGHGAKIEQPDYEFGSWHEISLVWTDYATYYFLDGQCYASNNDIAPLEGAVPAYICYSIYGAGDPNNPDALNETLKVDWMRIYK